MNQLVAMFKDNRFFGKIESSFRYLELNRSHDGTDDDDGLSRHFRLVYFLTIVVALFPVLMVDVPPLVDLPNHLSRIYILANIDTIPLFAETFDVVYKPIPNLAMELIIVPLIPLLGTEAAGSFFVLLTIALFALGCYSLAAIKAPQGSYVPVITVFFIYGFTMFYGFVNYLFGISIFLITFSLWFRWRDEMRFWHYSVLVALAYVAYLSHLSAIAFLAISIGVVRLTDILAQGLNLERAKKILFDGLFFILPTISFFSYVRDGGHESLMLWGTFAEKCLSFLGPFRVYGTALDVVWPVGLAVFFIVLIVFGRPKVEKSFLMIGLIFLTIAAFSPTRISSVSYTDIRFILPGFILIALSLSASKLPKWQYYVLIPLLTIAFVRQASIAIDWISVANKVKAQRKLIDAIEPQSRIFPVFARDYNAAFDRVDYPLKFVANYATIQRQAFLPTIFAIHGQQPLVFRNEAIRVPSDSFILDTNTAQAGSKIYDYILTYKVDQRVIDHLSGYADIAASDDETIIWKLQKPASHE